MNRYEILQTIGAGGMAEVYKARDTALNRLVAVKVLRREYSTDEKFVERFRVEAQSAAGLSHPNIVSVYDVGEENGIYFIVMELVDGITLKDYIVKKEKLQIREALNISVQIAQGLSAAHANGIIHRDIKPQNIIISRAGKVKVTDFGIAKMAGSNTMTTTAAGTVSYISPEQARGGYSDERSDIYSLGITMYEMLTGQVPYEGETNIAVALLHIQGDMVPPKELEPSIPESFNKIILKCTQKKPERRYAKARDLIADLRMVLTNPDGAYVAIAGAGVPSDGTINMDEAELTAIKEAAHKEDLSKGDTGKQEIRKDSIPVKQTEKANPEDNSRKKNGVSQDTSIEDIDDDMDSSLGKILMILGIIGAIILVIVVISFAAMASGILKGGFSFFGKKAVTETKAVTESITETETETQTETETESESETKLAFMTMPNLIESTEKDAREILKDIDVEFDIQEGKSDYYEVGQIYDQYPDAGTTLSQGDTVTLYVCAGAESFELDDVSGMDYNQASDKLRNQGLSVYLEFENSDSVSKDLVIRTDPEAGSSVTEGTTITIYASEGPEIRTSTVPDLRGYDLDSAISMIEEAGLTYNGKSSEYSDTYDEGTVMDQSLSPESTVNEGTNITLVVSMGPRQHTYHATVYISTPFEGKIVDNEGNPVSEGLLTVVIVQDGESKAVFDQSVTKDTMPASIDCTSNSNSEATAEFYLNDIQYDSASVSFY